MLNSKTSNDILEDRIIMGILEAKIILGIHLQTQRRPSLLLHLRLRLIAMLFTQLPLPSR